MRACVWQRSKSGETFSVITRSHCIWHAMNVKRGNQFVLFHITTTYCSMNLLQLKLLLNSSILFSPQQCSIDIRFIFSPFFVIVISITIELLFFSFNSFLDCYFYSLNNFTWCEALTKATTILNRQIKRINEMYVYVHCIIWCERVREYVYSSRFFWLHVTLLDSSKYNIYTADECKMERCNM